MIKLYPMLPTLLEDEDSAKERKMKYAIVPQGCYGSGDIINPRRVCKLLATALKNAKKLTGAYQKAMRPHGGSSGGYRVIEVEDNETRRNTSWFGHELDRIPSVKER